MVEFLQTCYYSYPATPLANYTPPEGAFPAAVYPTYTAAGVWSYFSLDSGVAVIHLTPTTDNQLLFMERPGNREADVRTCCYTCPAELVLNTRGQSLGQADVAEAERGHWLACGSDFFTAAI